MKVLIVGSAKGLSSDAAEKMQTACRDLGSCLARSKHTIIVSSDEPETADLWMVEGADLTPGSHEVLVVIRGESSQPAPFSKLQDELKNLTFRYRQGEGPRSVGRIQAIKECDAVLVIGGADGTTQAGWAAFALGKPVLAVPVFGGAARELWKVVSPYYTQAGVTKDEVGDLATGCTAELVVSTLSKISKRNPFRSAEYRFRLYLLGVFLVLFFAWAALFAGEYRTSLSRNFAVYGMLVISAFLGAALRFALALIPEDPLPRMLTQLVNDLFVAAALAFGFSLLYLAGGYVVTGDFVQLNESKDFVRVAITMSLLAFGGAFTVDLAVQTLRERVGSFLGSTK